MKYIFYAILIYLAYQLVFKLIIPVYIASRRFKKQFREMQGRMQEQMQQQKQHDQDTARPGTASAAAGGSRVNPEDYIEFEEVR